MGDIDLLYYMRYATVCLLQLAFQLEVVWPVGFVWPRTETPHSSPSLYYTNILCTSSGTVGLQGAFQEDFNSRR